MENSKRAGSSEQALKSDDGGQARKIKTKLGTEVEITEKNIVHLVDGLLGFEDIQNYALIPHGEESPFLLLQSIEEPSLAFITMDPRVFAQDYAPEISAEDLGLLGIDDFSQAVILSIVVIPDDARRMTANLQAPLVINVETRTGRQVISRSTHHKVRHYILGEPAPPDESGREPDLPASKGQHPEGMA